MHVMIWKLQVKAIDSPIMSLIVKERNWAFSLTRMAAQSIAVEI